MTSLSGKGALITGASSGIGAATALALALAREGISRLTIANRNREKAQHLATLVAQAAPGCDVRPGSDDPGDHDVVINATSLGLKPDDALPCDTSKLTPAMVAAVIAGCLVASVKCSSCIATKPHA